MNKIIWSKKAKKQILRINRHEAIVIYERVDVLKHFPECQNIKKLRNHNYGYRLRVGNYRVLFDYDSMVRIISIEEVKKRDERTY